MLAFLFRPLQVCLVVVPRKTMMGLNKKEKAFL